jgi:hypothetical protein
MSEHRARVGGLLTAIVLTVALAGCGDNDGENSGGGAGPRSTAPLAFELPPEFRDCLVNKGFEIPASGDLHDLDPARVGEAIQACGEFLHP